ncbi:hypothetical protein C8R44DRAFT_885941 [Mycena epipterygia]|nr:hypothetical protein C8R44DRAFT_885941 [Mycena epipterygia]
MSSRQDRVQSVSIHHAPAHFSKAQFEQKMDEFIDAFIDVPAVKENALKIKMLVPNNNLDVHIQAVGLPVPNPTVIVLCEWVSQEKMLETACDPTLMKVVAGAIADFGLDAGSCVFHSDIMTKIDISGHQDFVQGFSIHPVPAHLSKAQFEQKMEALVDALIAVPVFKNNAFGIEMLVQSSTLDTDIQALHVQGLGLPAPHPTVVILVQWKSQGQLQEVMSDAAVKKLIARAIADFSLHVDSCAGAADTVTKFEKTN